MFCCRIISRLLRAPAHLPVYAGASALFSGFGWFVATKRMFPHKKHQRTPPRIISTGHSFDTAAISCPRRRHSYQRAPMLGNVFLQTNLTRQRNLQHGNVTSFFGILYIIPLFGKRTRTKSHHVQAHAQASCPESNSILYFSLSPSLFRRIITYLNLHPKHLLSKKIV